jgi:hypothetical protein
MLVHLINRLERWLNGSEEIPWSSPTIEGNLLRGIANELRALGGPDDLDAFSHSVEEVSVLIFSLGRTRTWNGRDDFLWMISMETGKLALVTGLQALEVPLSADWPKEFDDESEPWVERLNRERQELLWAAVVHVRNRGGQIASWSTVLELAATRLLDT